MKLKVKNFKGKFGEIRSLSDNINNSHSNSTLGNEMLVSNIVKHSMWTFLENNEDVKQAVFKY